MVTTGLVEGAAGFAHCPVLGSVSHRAMLTGNAADPVSAEAIILPRAPRFATVTANIPFFARFKMPSFVEVAAKATASGIGVVEAERCRVLTPTLLGAGLAFVQSKLRATSVGAIAVVGVKAKT